MPDLFEHASTCVVVPTYNNERTLARVLDGILTYTCHLIVVNDGSTDGTAAILAGYPSIKVTTHPRNCGKGVALRSGFREARTLGYKNVVTIDSDGQHFPTDLPAIAAAAQAHPGTLIIGQRNMTQEGVPGKSSFGNNFSNFWFRVETGIKLGDTQSGFRLYPISCMSKYYFTTKFELEIEVIVRAAWRGIPVMNIPIAVSYDKAERVSHFRPVKDFTRISILNTVLVAMTPLGLLRMWMTRAAKPSTGS